MLGFVIGGHKYRTTPHPEAGKTPAELIFGRQVRTRLDLLYPSEKKTSERRKIGEPIWMRNYSGKGKWIPGVMISKLGPLSYTIDAGGQENTRHIDQLKERVIHT